LFKNKIGNFMKVAIVMGSVSDDEIMRNCERYLQYFGVEYEKMVLSAHRNPIETIEFARNAEERGFKVIIAGAGMAAHLPGVIAANTTLPVIGVPIPSSELNGVDSLYSIVQMPPGIPVATVAIGKAGAVNAAVLAVQMLALQDENLKKKLEEFRSKGSKL
jgi:phosphoribosylaminoimidazole carboxylase PurE protein